MHARLAILFVLGAGCSPQPPPAQALVWARGADSTSLDPAELEWLEDIKVTYSLYETLLSFKEGSVELEGRLAQSWSVAQDGLTCRIQLRSGVKFHDGTPLTADSVVFSFERVLRPDHPHRPRAVPYAANFSDIEGVEPDGANDVVFTLKNPSAIFLYTLTLPAASIVSPASLRKQGSKLAAEPCGTGPYRLSRWDRDVRIVLDRFEDYWGPKPTFPRIIVVPVGSPQTAVQKLKKGEVHVVDHPSLGDVKALEEDPSTRVSAGTSMNVCYLGFNLKRCPYSDPHFRRAVSLALDRRGLNDLAYHGLAEPASNLVPPLIWRDLCPTPPYECDLDRAKAELAKVHPQAGEVELIYMTFPRHYMPEPDRVAEFVKDRLGKIGLKVKLTAYDKAAYTVKMKEEGHPMYLYGWTADYPDPDNFYFTLLHGDNAGDLNGSYFNDPEFNDAVRKAQREIDPARRNALYAKAYARYRDELPTLPLVHLAQRVGLSRSVTYPLHPIEIRFYSAKFTN